MTIDRNELRTLMIAHAKWQTPLIDECVADAEQLLAATDAGDLPFAKSGEIDDFAFGEALSQATGRDADIALAISSADEPLQDLYLDVPGYQCTLPSALTGLRRAAFYETHGTNTLSDLIEPLWQLLGEKFVRAFAKTCPRFMGDASWELSQPVACGALVVLAYSMAYASMGDRVQYDQLRPLLTQLHRAAPIGIPADEQGLWLVLVR